MLEILHQTSNLNNYYFGQPYELAYIFEEFQKDIYFNVFFQNIDYLYENSSVAVFNKDHWIHKPDVFCAEFYSHHFYWPVILLVNDLGSIFNFHPDNLRKNYIICPSKTSMHTLIKNKIDL